MGPARAGAGRLATNPSEFHRATSVMTEPEPDKCAASRARPPAPIHEPSPNYNLHIGLALFFGVLLIGWLVADLLDSKAGERVAALGAIIGGIIGAGGAVFAVYLAITGQRNEDASKVRAAVRTEVATYAKYLINTLELCEQIAKGEVQFRMSHATSIGMSLVEPVIYNAVADRIALLQRPQETVEFYMRNAEAKSNLQAIQMHGASLNPALQAMVHVQPDIAQDVADSLITALQFARSILADPHPMDIMIQTISLQEIDAALAHAQQTFPTATSFQAPA